MNAYRILYRQTEYRNLTVEAESEDEVRRLIADGSIWLIDGDDEYVDAEDAEVLTVEEQ